MAWKYSLVIQGTKDQLDKFKDGLCGLGYTPSSYMNPYSEGDVLLTCRKECKETGYDYFRPVHKRVQDGDYTLQLPGDYDLALALAACQDDNTFHKGEILRYAGHEENGSRYGTLCKFVCYDTISTSISTSRIYKVRFLGNGAETTVLEACLTKAPAFEIISWYNHFCHRLVNSEVDGQTCTPKEEAPARKIIGYKAPFDMFGGKIPAGVVYRPLGGHKITTYAAVDDQGHVHDDGCTNLPAEIVERWEPVYEKGTSMFSVFYTDNQGCKGQLEIKIIAEQETIQIGSHFVLVEYLQDLYRHLRTFPKVAGYESRADRFSVGCKHDLNLSDLSKILVEYDKLNGGNS